MDKIFIGMPVYNSKPEKFKKAVESVLSQSYRDFTLFIADQSDNDSLKDLLPNDDARIVYIKNTTGRGNLNNFKYVLNEAIAQKYNYFKWMADDDILFPDFLKECVEPLVLDEEIILCYPMTLVNSFTGEKIIWQDDYTDLTENPAFRFRDFLGKLTSCCPIYGVYNLDLLKKLRWASEEANGIDVVLLCQLPLWGKILRVSKILWEYDFGDNWNPAIPMEKRIGLNYRATGLGKIGITFPWCQMGFDVLMGIQNSNIPEDDKGRCIRFYQSYFNSRIYPNAMAELDRAVMLCDANWLDKNWDDEQGLEDIGHEVSKGYLNTLCERLDKVECLIGITKQTSYLKKKIEV